MSTKVKNTAVAGKPSLSSPGLLILDMDSTLIQCECIDEIADKVGLKPQVSALNDKAMRGEIDFAESLLACMTLLAGTEEKILSDVYKQKAVLTDGAEILINNMQLNGWKVGLVSGGFTYFTERLKQSLNLDFAVGNQLEIINGKLTGQLIGEIVTSQTKADCLVEKAALYKISLSQTLAVGDGANDLAMLKKAGLGIAFCAKPIVRAQVKVAINEGGLDQVLQHLGP